MTAEFGLFFLILALLAALLQAAFLLPAGQAFLTPCLRPAAWLQALCITLAFATLMSLRLSSDFSVINVVEHSSRALPTLYKIAGTWGNHEGSMLLWVLVLAVFGLILALRPPRSVIPCAVAVQALLAAGVLLFILCTSNPFARIFPPLPDGEALNPLLQDIGLSVHPPLLYLGYVGFSIVFSLAVAALLQGRMERDWAELAHPWILASWSALTIGIGLGSWWAYRTLGWGGFWFWDPVENASLLPWLSGTALLHANIVLKKRGILKSWVLLLSIITFGLSLLGTFLVRSGVLISVHSFASDPTRGLFILGYIAVVLGGALLLFAWRAGKIGSEGGMLPLSREGMIVVNNMFLLTACATVLLGTLYPMLAEWLAHEKLTVGPPYFNAVFFPLFAVPLAFAGLTPFMPWKKARIRHSLRQAAPSAMAGIAVLVLVMALCQRQWLLSALGLGLAMWLAASSVQWLMRKRGVKGALSVFLGHVGAATLVAGITCASLWKQENERWMGQGETMDMAGYRITYDAATPVAGPNYRAIRSRFIVTGAHGNTIAVLSPEYRIYDIRNSASSVAAIDAKPWRDLYIVTGQSSADGKRTSVRCYYRPWIGLIWGGCVLMALGGITAIIRRIRL